MPSLRLLLVDDHEIVRLGLKSLLDRQPDFDVVAEASSGEEAVRLAMDHRPDLVLMDVRLPGISGIEACAQIVATLPDTKVLILTSHAEEALLFSAIRAGAVGYLLKQIDSRELLKGIEAAAHGDAPLDSRLTWAVFSELRKTLQDREASAFADLTQQEMKVLALMTEGKSNREIATTLFLTEHTVRNYASVVFAKLHVADRTEAAAYAARHDLKDFLAD